MDYRKTYVGDTVLFQASMCGFDVKRGDTFEVIGTVEGKDRAFQFKDNSGATRLAQLGTAWVKIRER